MITSHSKAIQCPNAIHSKNHDDTGSGLYAVVKTTAYMAHAVRKFQGEDLTKIIERHRSVIINTNFFFYPSLHLFISIYYDKSGPLNYFN